MLEGNWSQAGFLANGLFRFLKLLSLVCFSSTNCHFHSCFCSLMTHLITNFEIQCLAKKLVILPISLINWPFSSEDFKPQQPCYFREHLVPNSMRLEASKKVLLVHVPQGTAKLQAVKVLVLQKIKSVHRWRCFHMKI